VSADTEFCVPKDGISWFTDKTVRVCEYWYKEKASKEIAQLSDGRVVDVDEKLEALAPIYEANGITVLRTRTVDYDQVKHCIVSGKEILEGPNEWPGKFIPIVPVWGDIVNIEGKDVISGMTRFSKDAQRAYNFERATFMETLAVQPSAPFIAPAQSIIKYRGQYENLGVTNVPVLLYDADPKLPDGGKPERAAPPAFPAALANAAQISSDDIKATSGIYDASLGARSNETSGKAILARQREGDVSNFVYIDNLAYAMRYGYEIINDLIPKVYDTERQIRIIGDDGGQKVIRVNKAVEVAPGDFETMYDLSQGKFDIAVTVGPSYTTQRMETAEALQQFVADPSPLGMLAKYGFLKALDTPGMEEIVKAARKMLVSGGLFEPEEGDQPPPPPQPDPKTMADAEKAKAGARLDNAKAEGQELENQAQAFVRDALVAPMVGMVPPPPPMAQAGFGPPDPAAVLPMGPMGA